MKLAFLPSAIRALLTFRDCQIGAAPDGRAEAQDRFLALVKTFRAHDFPAHGIEGRSVRRYDIPESPLSVLYLAQEDRVEILDLCDIGSRYVREPQAQGSR